MTYASATSIRRHRLLWRRAYFRLIPCAVLALAGAFIVGFSASIHLGTINRRIILLIGVIMFVGFSMTCLHIVTSTVRKIASHYLGPSRAANAEFFLVVAGYLVILFTTLGLLRIPVGKLLLGGAVSGIVIGVAAQQALANFFASVILLLTQPYVVGEQIVLRSGALGGEYRGTVVDIGLTHTRMHLEDDSVVLLPNASILGGAAILPVQDLPPSARTPQEKS
jgi:small-conductance mechanosensitive channel